MEDIIHWMVALLELLAVTLTNTGRTGLVGPNIYNREIRCLLKLLLIH